MELQWFQNCIGSGVVLYGERRQIRREKKQTTTIITVVRSVPVYQF